MISNFKNSFPYFFCELPSLLIWSGVCPANPLESVLCCEVIKYSLTSLILRLWSPPELTDDFCLDKFRNFWYMDTSGIDWVLRVSCRSSSSEFRCKLVWSWSSSGSWCWMEPRIEAPCTKDVCCKNSLKSSEYCSEVWDCSCSLTSYSADSVQSLMACSIMENVIRVCIACTTKFSILLLRCNTMYQTALFWNPLSSTCTSQVILNADRK